MTKKIVFLFLAAFSLFYGCRQKDSRGITTETPVQTDNISNTGSDNDFSNLNDFTRETTAPEAHKKYLNDPVVYMELPHSGSSGQTAVVGNRTALFYPDVLVSNQDDIANLTGGIPLPYGTVIPVTGVIEESSFAYDGLFAFEDHFNYFYKTEWEGREGLVFGADLYGAGDSPEHNAIAALYYKQNGRFTSFPPFNK